MALVIQYLDPSTNQMVNAAAQIYVRAGATVRFKVIANPPVAPPANLSQAVWSNGAHGDTTNITFNAPSAGTGPAQGTAVSVTAAGQTARVAVTVYRLTLQLAPAVVTQTNPRTNFGVDERINLSFATTPAGISAAAVGGLRWRLPGIAGRKRKGVLQKTATDKTAPGTDGLAYYIAPYLTDDANETIQNAATKAVTLELAVAGGPCNGQADPTNITIHRPTGVLRPIAGEDKHEQDEPSAGFVGTINLTPDDVSFSTLEFREASGSLTATGCFKSFADGWERSGTWVTESSHTPTIIGGEGLSVSRQANRNEAGEDSVWTPYGPGTGASRYAGWDGTFIWKIYWQYRVRQEFRGAESNNWVRFQVAEHRSVSDATGHCVTTKAGGQAAFNRTDPTSP
jgi:hypothetical protein